MLNLESFDENKKKHQEKKDDECKEYKEKIQFLQLQIKKIQEGYKQKLAGETEKIKEETYKSLEGEFTKKLEEEKESIKNLLREEFEKEYNEKLNQVIAKKEEEIKEQYKELFPNFEESINKTINSYKSYFQDILLEILEDIFETLTFDKSNLDLVKQEIQKLLDEFIDYKPIKIKVNPFLAEILNFKEIKIQPEENFNTLDFEIEFENFKLKKEFEDIKKQVLDEIKREIKKD